MLYLKQNKLFLVERSTRRVSGVWKVLHVTLFYAIAINFFFNSILLGRLFKSFQYNCILFCTNVTFDQESLPLNSFNKENFATITDEEITDKIFVDLKNKNALGKPTERDITDVISVATERRLLGFSSGEDGSDESLELSGDVNERNKKDGEKETKHKVKKESKVNNQNERNKRSSDKIAVKEENISDTSHEKINDTYNKENATNIQNNETVVENTTVIFKNETIYMYTNEVETILVHATLNLAKSRFPSGYLCNLALCTVLSTFIWGLFFGVMMTMCSRGGEGYISDILSRPQNYLYWIVVTSAIYEILNFVVLSIFERGMEIFCEEFEIFTGTKQCSSSMDHFTVQFNNKNNERINFYLWYLAVKYTLYVGLALIGSQILITLLRILCLADYQLYEVQLEDKSQTETMNETSRQNSVNVDTTTEEFASTMS